MDKTNKIIHKRSSVILENGKAKLPTTDQLEYGELAINFAKGAETISFKNNNDEIVSITTSTALEDIIESNMQNVQASIDAINNTIEQNEHVVSLALTNLDERVNTNTNAITTLQNEALELENRINASLTGKADTTVVTALAGRVETNEGAITDLKAADTAMDAAYKAADTKIREDFAAADTAIRGEIAKKADSSVVTALDGRVEANEGAISGLQTTVSEMDTTYKAADTAIRGEFAAADTALEGRVDGKLAAKADKTTVEAIDNRLTELEEGVIENEETTAKALTNLDTRVTKVYEDFAAADTTLKNELNGEIAKKADSSVVTALAGRVETNESEITKLNGLEQAYKAADTKIREDFAAADTALKNELNGAIAKKANQSDFETLVGRVDVVQGTDTGKSMRTVAAEEAAKEVAKVVAEADADFDTLKEIADWILNDKTGAAALQNDVAGLKDVVDGYEGKGAIKSVVEAIDNRLTDLEEGVIENEEIIATALTDLDERLNNIPNEFAAADTALKNELTTAINKKADAESVAAFDSRISNNASAITALQTADTKIREDFAAADTALKNELNGAIVNKADKSAIEAIDNRLTNLETGVIENEQVVAGVINDLNERVISIENVIEENEEITANLFAEMDSKILELEGKVKNADIDGGEF